MYKANISWHIKIKHVGGAKGRVEEEIGEEMVEEEEVWREVRKRRLDMTAKAFYMEDFEKMSLVVWRIDIYLLFKEYDRCVITERSFRSPSIHIHVVR